MPMLAGGNLVGVLNVNVTRGHRHMTLGQVKALSILVSIIAPILENTWLNIQIRQAEEKYRSIFENATEAIYQSTPEGQFITVNTAMAAMLGYDTPEELISAVTDIASQLYVNPEERTKIKEIIKNTGQVKSFETRFYRKDGSMTWVSINMHTVCDKKGNIVNYEGFNEDISERKREEQQQILINKVLEALSRPNEIVNLIRDILLLLKEHTSIEAIGIRLREGDDFPYYVTNGFPPHFLEAENHLCARDNVGEIIRDSQGNPYLECMCGNVLCGRTDPKFPFFTECGSFWSNRTTELLASTSEEDRQARTRNRCNSEGYESVALIPLRSGEQMIGLLQLNDSRRDSFTIEMIKFIEGIGSTIGIAVARKRAEEALRKSEERYRSIFENTQEGIFRSTPEGRIILANQAMAKMFGYESPEEGMTSITDVIRQHYVNPEDRRKLKEIIEEHGFIKGYEVQNYRKDGSIIWSSMTMYAVRNEKGQIMYYDGIIEDITTRKESAGRLRKALGATVQAIAVTVEARDPYTAGHQRRVADLARAIATEMNLSADQIDGIPMVAAIHDLGKISVPAEILSKPTKLTNIEFNLIKTHAQSGHDILKDIDFPWPVARIVLEHHERMNGSGYPHGLTGDNILIESRILAVADVVEAMASHRPYRPAIGLDAGLKEIETNKGTLYDADVVDASLRVFREKGFQLAEA